MGIDLLWGEATPEITSDGDMPKPVLSPCLGYGQIPNLMKFLKMLAKQLLP